MQNTDFVASPKNDFDKEERMDSPKRRRTVDVRQVSCETYLWNAEAHLELINYFFEFVITNLWICNKEIVNLICNSEF